MDHNAIVESLEPAQHWEEYASKQADFETKEH